MFDVWNDGILIFWCITLFRRKFCKFRNNSKPFQTFPKIQSISTFLAYFVKQVVILNIGFGFCVFVLYMGTYFRRSRRRRRVPSSSSSSSVRPVVSPVVRPVVVVRPLSVRTVVRRRPSSVRPSVPSSVPSSSSILCPSVPSSV